MRQLCPKDYHLGYKVLKIRERYVDTLHVLLICFIVHMGISRWYKVAMMIFDLLVLLHA